MRPGSFPSHQWAALNVDPLLLGASPGLLAAAARTGAEVGCMLTRAGFVSSLHASLDQLRGRVQPAISEAGRRELPEVRSTLRQ